MTTPKARLRVALRRALSAGACPEALPSTNEIRVIQIWNHEGAPAGWLVGLFDDSELRGFVQFAPDLQVRRCGAGAALSTLFDPARARAALQRFAEGAVGHPYMGYDGSPDRLAWFAREAQAATSGRLLMYAGDRVEIVTPSRGRDVTG